MKIHIPTPLRQYTGGQQTVTVGGGTRRRGADAIDDESS